MPFKDNNHVAINRAIALIEARGLSYKNIQLIGSNYMSHASHMQSLREFAVLAYKGEMIEWYTFTYKFRARSLRNETELHHDNMVDMGNFYHPNNMDTKIRFNGDLAIYSVMSKSPENFTLKAHRNI